jgi:hypothetical protein
MREAMPQTPDLQSQAPLVLDDSLGRNDCIGTPACRRAVANLRREATHALPPESRALTAAARAAGIDAAGVFDLESYPNIEAIMDHVRGMTAKPGRVNREIARARRLGYTARPFPFRLHVPDMVAIHHSKDTRDGRPIESAFYKRGIDELGGAPAGPVEMPAKDCAQHYTEYWGVFRPLPGHVQGAVITDEQLVGYVGLDRCGDSLWYSSFMGHGDFLRDGIMYLLHYALVAELLERRPPGLRYLVYYPYARRLKDQSTHWKQLTLFTPRYLRSVDDHRLSIPSPETMPSASVALLALKTIPFTYWPKRVRDSAVHPEWIAFLHRMQVVANLRAAKLPLNVLWSDKAPSLDTLRPLAQGLFPVEALAGVQTAAVLLQGRDRGLEALLPLHDLGLLAVDVFHADPAELALIQAIYPASWRYAPFAADRCAARAARADLAVIEQPLTESIAFLRPQLEQLLRDAPGRMLVGIDQPMLDFLKASYRDTDRIAQGMSEFLGPVHCRGMFFRYRYPVPAYWAWLERPHAGTTSEAPAMLQSDSI